MASIALRQNQNCGCGQVSAESAASGVAEIPTSAATRIELALITDRTEFNALETEWGELFARAGSSTQLFQTFNWCWHWCNTYLPPRAARNPESTLAVVTGRQNGRLVMVWPLVRRRFAGLVEVGWLGEPVTQYGDVLVEAGPEKAARIEAGWHYISTRLGADVITLRKVRADAEVAPVLKNAGARIVASELAPYLDFADAPDFATYEQRYSPGSRRNRKRLLRRLGEIGPVTFEHPDRCQRAREVLQLAVAHKRSWLKARGLVSRAFADDRIIEFFAAVAKDRVHPTGCRIEVLNCGGVPAAIQVGIDCKGRHALHILTYDERFERSGAGVLLLEASIKSSFDRGIRSFDLLAPYHDYKMDWADATISVDDHALGLTVKGRLYVRAYLAFIRELLKSAVKHGPRLLGKKPSGDSRRGARRPAQSGADPRGPLAAPAKSETPV